MEKLAALVLAPVLVACSGSTAATESPSSNSYDVGGEVAAEETSIDDAAPESEPVDAPITDPCVGKEKQPLDATWSFPIGGVTRTFDVHVPASYSPGKKTPLVFNFHGYTSDSKQQNLLALMNAKSDKEGFVAVHPQGISNSWNAGACCGEAASTKVDDIGFVSKMLDELESKLCVDDKRVYATGMSNGGFISHRLGCELSDRIAAIAPVAGVLGIATCTPKRPVPVIHFHGTLDSLVPYAGNPGMGFPAVQDTFAGWAKRDGCTGDAKETFRNVDSHCSTYSTCMGGAEVTLCTVDGGGHTWPGGTPVPSLGYTTPNMSATDKMWTFFVAHPMP